METKTVTTAAPAPDERTRVIIQTIHDLRPMLQADGGDMELVEIAGDIVRVGLKGACTHCGMAGQTLGAVRRKLVEALGDHVRVLPAQLS